MQIETALLSEGIGRLYYKNDVNGNTMGAFWCPITNALRITFPPDTNLFTIIQSVRVQMEPVDLELSAAIEMTVFVNLFPAELVVQVGRSVP